jgi:predicted ATPase
LCVFTGSFELDAVEGVCTGDIAGDEMVDLVSVLVDKSIVVRHERGTVAQYRLLETIREFGLERLNEAGDGPALLDAPFAVVCRTYSHREGGVDQ